MPTRSSCSPTTSRPIHIEEAFHGRRGPDSTYEPFDGIVLTDTFNLHTDRTGFPMTWLPNNSERVERQQKLPIQVIVGNPPWSGKQKSAGDNNPTIDYPELEKRVGETYVRTLQGDEQEQPLRHLQDGDPLGIGPARRPGRRPPWSPTAPGIDGNVDSGVRACLAEEFSSIHVLNLRGNQRTQGERSRREGGKVFGQGSRAPVAITILVRNPDAAHSGCHIRYRDVGDYLKREEKLAILRKAGSIAGIGDWRTITPDRHHDWIGQRSDAFQKLYPIGSKDAKAGKAGDAIFKLYSNGYYTGKDPYIYNFSRAACVANARAMVGDYQDAMEVRKEHQEYTINDVTKIHSENAKWDQTLKARFQAGRQAKFSSDHIRRVAYRPFVATHCYADDLFSKRPGIRGTMFPDAAHDNRAICVPGVGSTKPFSALVVDTMPDLNLLPAGGQWFPAI